MCHTKVTFVLLATDSTAEVRIHECSDAVHFWEIRSFSYLLAKS